MRRIVILASALADIVAVCVIGAAGLYAVWGYVQAVMVGDVVTAALWFVVMFSAQYITHTIAKEAP